MAAAAVDISLLSSFCEVPQPHLQTLIESPTTDLVTSFLQSLINRAQEFEQLKSDRLRLDVELENAIRGGESKAKALKANNDKASLEIQDLKSKVTAAETERESLQGQLQEIQTSSSRFSEETKGFESQVARLEQSNRDTLSLLNAKSTSYDKLAEDLTAQHQKTVALRREISTLEERAQNAESTLSNAKFRESALQSEVELLKRNNAWFETELKTKSEEYSKSRQEKNARISELQRTNEEVRQTVEALQRTENSLRQRVEELGQKADGAFTKIQQLQEDAARKEENFQAELDTQRRLANLQKQSADTARNRVKELEDEVEQTKEDAGNELGQVQAELETEREGRETAEQRTEQLESELERLSAELEASHQDAGATPRARSHGLGDLHTPTRSRSPAAFTPGSTRSRGGTTFTQLVTEHNAMKTELDEEKRNHAKIREACDEMLRELEQKQPELQEAELERERLEGEVSQLSTILDEVRQEKETARKDARKSQSQLDGHQRKAKALEQQLRDLSAQVKILLVEVQIRDQGVQLSATEREQLQEAAQMASDGVTFEGMTDTGRFISERLVAFKDVFELQTKNMELTKIVRELGESREEEEAKARSAQESQEAIELNNLKDQVERYKDEVKNLVTQSQSYIRERDMFRRMLSHRGQLPPDADLASMFGSSVNGAASPQTSQITRQTPEPNQTSSTKDISDYSKLLKELQSHFDSYRRESASDLKTLRDQGDALAKEKNQLLADIARANSQVTLGQERYQMLQSAYDQLKTETSEFRKRYDTLAENAAKQDVRTQQVAEELIEAKSLVESIRNENSNLKAEKELWKRIEERLMEDSRAVMEERTRLNKVLGDTQHLANERELSDAETRRKLQSQAESLESELKSTKQKLEEEAEASKNANLRREFEQEQSRSRIDDLVKSLANVKEELAAATTARDQLQSRVDELKIELRTADERTQALQPRPTPRDTSSSETDIGTNEQGLNREQELGFEVANLKRELEFSKAELENARGQIEQYRAISQSSEEELQSLNDAHDQFKEDADKVANEKDEKIKDLEQRLQDTGDELEATSNQLSELQNSQAEHQNRADQQQATFESELKQLRDDCQRYKETADMRLGDLKAQAELTQQAQQSYEGELVKHAEAAKTLQKVREELNLIKLELSQAKADAEAAKTTLSQSEDSWSANKERYENEISEAKSRRSDMESQNKLLHTQLENISGQIASLQQNRTSSGGESAEQDVQVSPSSSLQNLQEVIKYLRREKEIVDVQYELSVQETRRLKQQLDYAQSQLDDARLKIDNERQRQADKEENSINHKKLMDTINELNVFRESSVTLRNEARQAQSQLAEKTNQVEELTTQIEPLKGSIKELENRLETSQGEYKLLEEDRNRWHQRTQSILQKYDRIDPAELEELKEKLNTLEAERDNAVSEKQTLQQQVEGFNDEIVKQREEARTDLRDKLSQQFKARSRELTSLINTEKSEKQQLQTQLDSLKSELDTVKTERDEAVQKVQTSTSNGNATNATEGDTEMHNTADEGQQDQTQTPNPSIAELQARLESAEKSAADRLAELGTAQAESHQLRERADNLQTQVNELEQKVDSSQTSPTGHGTTNAAVGEGALTKLKEHLSPIEEDLRTLIETLTSLRDQQADASLQEQIQNMLNDVSVLQAKLSELYSLAPGEESDTTNGAENLTAEAIAAKSEEIRAELEGQYKTRVDNMRTQLSTKLAEGKAAYREQINKERDQAIQEAQSRFAAEKEEAVESLQKQVESLKTATSGAEQHPGNGSSIVTSAPAATENSFNEDSTIKVKSESALPGDQANMEQVRAFIQDNAHVKSIMAQNLRKRLEAEVAKAKSQHETETAEKLEDMRQKSEKAKETAVLTESKKSAAKLNMTENRARTFQAKIEVVEKAAKETPQRPVAEVWLIAKDTKPAPLSVQTPGQSNAQTPTRQAGQPGTPSSAKPPVTVQQPSSSPTPAPAVSEQKPPQAATAEAPATTDQKNSESAQPAATQPETAGQDAPATHQLPPKPQAQGGRRPSQVPQPAGTGPAALRGLSSQGTGIPRGGASVRGAGARGGAANAGANSQTQPVDQQQEGQVAQRGGAASSLPRGGGRGSVRGRGGVPNPNARQFVPGNKRPREESTGDQGNKRPRGGGQGGAQ